MLARGVGAMHRRVMAISKRGEGDRFNHFFAQNELGLSCAKLRLSVARLG